MDERGRDAATRLRVQRLGEVELEEELRWLWLASSDACELWDDESWSVLSSHHVELARAAGAFSMLPLTLNNLAVAKVLAGELDAAASHVAELDALCEATGTEIAPYTALVLAAWRGREREFGDLIRAALGDVVARGEGVGVLIAQWARAVLANGLGRYTEAAVAAREAGAHPLNSSPGTGA